MNATDTIIGKFGGLTELSKALGHKHPTTVQGWKARGHIPAKQIPLVIEAGKALGIAIAHADFFMAPTQENEPANDKAAADPVEEPAPLPFSSRAA